MLFHVCSLLVHLSYVRVSMYQVHTNSSIQLQQGRQSTSECESFQLLYGTGEYSGHSAFGTPGAREYSVISAFDTPGTRKYWYSVFSAFDTPGTRYDSVISAFGTQGTRELSVISAVATRGTR